MPFPFHRRGNRCRRRKKFPQHSSGKLVQHPYQCGTLSLLARWDVRENPNGIGAWVRECSGTANSPKLSTGLWWGWAQVQRSQGFVPGRPGLRWLGHPQSFSGCQPREREAQRGFPARNISPADTFMTRTCLQNTGLCTALLSPAQLDITCSPQGCHLESGKPIYFPPQIGLVVLGRCRKPINHQPGLRVSISQEACHPPLP